MIANNKNWTKGQKEKILPSRALKNWGGVGYFMFKEYPALMKNW